jgi:outer membrane lipoprotein SlyB
MTKMFQRLVGASALALLCAASYAAAQAPDVVRVRGTIENVSGSMIDVKDRSGAALKVKVADNGPVNEVVKASLSDIKEGSYIAVTAMPQPDGSQKAIEISIFPPGVHPPDGFRPWDFAPNSTMTNATVADQVTEKDGTTLTVKYKDGEKKVIILPDALIVTSKKASLADMKSGQKVMVFAAKKLPDGSLEAPNISFGDYGVWR